MHLIRFKMYKIRTNKPWSSLFMCFCKQWQVHAMHHSPALNLVVYCTFWIKNNCCYRNKLGLNG